ncbi:MAG: hypothetical protein HPY83_08255 [Anaerolineae bacterium]|nr:hypothetical protein [Anaerolineae bacterium]
MKDQRGSAFYQAHQRSLGHGGGFVLLLALFVAFRLGSLFLFRPGGFLADFSDYYYYREYAALSDRGLYPYVNIWSPYPPVFPWLLVGLYRLSLLLPPWEQPQLVFNLLLSSVMAISEAGTLTMVHALARRVGGRGRALRSAAFYALLFLPAYTAQAHFDSLPVFLLLLSLWLALEGRWVLAGLAGGVGAMTKLLPALAFPVGLRRLAPDRTYLRQVVAGRAVLRYLGGGAAAVLAVAAPFLYLNPRLLLAPLDVQRIRPPWQTVWAVLDGYYGFGVAPADVRDLAALSGPAWQGRVPYGLLTLAFAGLYLGLYLARADWHRPRTAVAFAGLSLASLFVLSKGWSPQYLLWLLPFVAVLWPDWRGVVLALSLTFVNYLESHGYFILLPEEDWLLVLTTSARTVLLLGLASGLALDYLGRPWPLALLRRLAPAAAVLAVVGLALLSWRLVEAYSRSRYLADPARPAVEFLQAESRPGETLLFLRQPDLERFYPHLHRSLHLRTLDDRPHDGDLSGYLERQVAALPATGLWLALPREDEPTLAPDARRALAALAYLVGEVESGPYRLSHWIPRAGLTVLEPGVRFGPSVELVAWRWAVAEGGEALTVELIWRRDGPLEMSTSAFLHLTAEDLRPLTQSDGPPAWGEGNVLGRHPLDLRGLAEGRYLLLVGLYQPQSGRRLLTADGSDYRVLADLEVGSGVRVAPR